MNPKLFKPLLVIALIPGVAAIIHTFLEKAETNIFIAFMITISYAVFIIKD